MVVKLDVLLADLVVDVALRVWEVLLIVTLLVSLVDESVKEDVSVVVVSDRLVPDVDVRVDVISVAVVDVPV
jgi:hypothetical protein